MGLKRGRADDDVRGRADKFLRMLVDSQVPKLIPKLNFKVQGTPSRTKEQYDSRRNTKPRKLAGWGGRLGGFFKKGRKTKVWPKSRPKKRSTLSTLSSMQAKGIMYTKEIGISTTGVSNCVYLGHATFALDQYRKVMFLAILKKLFLKVNEVMKNVNDSANLIQNDVIVLESKPNQDSGQAVNQVVYAAGAVPQSYSAIADYFVANVNWSNPDIQFTRIYFNFLGGAGNTRVQVLPLENMTLEIYCKSSMKIQNATASGASDEADEVDNVPVNGKNYFGYGTGSTSNRSGVVEEQFWTRCDAGWMKCVPGNLTTGLTEMPSGSYFRNVKKVGKHRINPGKIVTSVLKDHYRISVNKLLKHLIGGLTHTTDVCHLGKFRFYGFEHVIKAAADAPSIKMLSEVNYQLCITAIPKYITVTDQQVEQAYAAY